jgi:N6-L-threonylcarbamoyladenine synthase
LEEVLLAIESSCDDTGLALITYDNDNRIGGFSVIKEFRASQSHEAYGGVVPELAAREHLKALPLGFKYLSISNPKEMQRLSRIVVTSGPGLLGSLSVGGNFASGLAETLNLPLHGVNHLNGHLFSPFIKERVIPPEFVALIVSGGHTLILHVQYEKGRSINRILGETLDDAAGEAFDKGANLLGISYPGGAKLAAMADEGEEYFSKYGLEVPTLLSYKVMSGVPNLSFSGIKSAFARLVKAEKETPNLSLINGSYSPNILPMLLQRAVIETLIDKLAFAFKFFKLNPNLPIAVSGGVAGNNYLRRRLTKVFPNTIFVAREYATDNGVMIGFAALCDASLDFTITRYSGGYGGSKPHFSIDEL